MIARFAEYIEAAGYGQPFFQFAELPIDITEEGIGFADAIQRTKKTSEQIQNIWMV